MKKVKLLLILHFSVFSTLVFGQYTTRIALLKYSGGGDWYANLETSLPNLIKYCNQHLKTRINPEQAIVEPGSPDIFNYPFVHITGHGNIVFSPAEVQNIRKYLEAGGFLHVSDNYGLDVFIRRELKKIFPDQELVEVPYSHIIYRFPFSFPDGLPKIHEHDNKPPKGYGIFLNGRLVCFYDYECDLGDGWEDPAVHKDSPETHEKALKMGANLIYYAFSRAE